MLRLEARRTRLICRESMLRSKAEGPAWREVNGRSRVIGIFHCSTKRGMILEAQKHDIEGGRMVTMVTMEKFEGWERGGRQLRRRNIVVEPAMGLEASRWDVGATLCRQARQAFRTPRVLLANHV
jgi:hypothetical protein